MTPLGGFRRRQGKRPHRPAVEAAEEGDHPRAAGDVTRELDRRFDGLGPGVGEKGLLLSLAGGDGAELFGECRHDLVVKIRPGHVDELLGLLLEHPHDFGVGVAQGVDRDPGGEIEELVAIRIMDVRALAPFDDQGISPGVRGGDDLLVALEDLAGLGTGKTRADLRGIAAFFGRPLHGCPRNGRGIITWGKWPAMLSHTRAPRSAPRRSARRSAYSAAACSAEGKRSSVLSGSWKRSSAGDAPRPSIRAAPPCTWPSWGWESGPAIASSFRRTPAPRS